MAKAKHNPKDPMASLVGPKVPVGPVMPQRRTHKSMSGEQLLGKLAKPHKLKTYW